LTEQVSQSQKDSVTQHHNVELLAELVKTYDDIQKVRIAVGNRTVPRCRLLCTKKQVKKGGVKRPCPYPDRECKDCEYWETKVHPIVLQIHKSLLSDEKAITKFLKDWVEDLPIWQQWLKHVKGVGAVLTAKLIAYSGDIRRFSTVGKYWAYFGQAPGQVRRKGEKANYSPVRKAFAWNLSESLIKAGGIYAEIYRIRAEYELTKGVSPTHARNRARRYVRKLFLQHFYAKSKELLGLPYDLPEIIGKEGHKHYIPPLRDDVPKETYKDMLNYLREKWLGNHRTAENHYDGV